MHPHTVVTMEYILTSSLFVFTSPSAYMYLCTSVYEITREWLCNYLVCVRAVCACICVYV